VVDPQWGIPSTFFDPHHVEGDAYQKMHGPLNLRETESSATRITQLTPTLFRRLNPSVMNMDPTVPKG
jgi:hypothetical protein